LTVLVKKQFLDDFIKRPTFCSVTVLCDYQFEIKVLGFKCYRLLCAQVFEPCHSKSIGRNGFAKKKL